MGLTQSNPETTKTYTNTDIKKKLELLFHTNRNSGVSAMSHSPKNLDNVVVSSPQFDNNMNQINMAPSPMTHMGGTHIKFNSSKNRHLLHNIQNYIDGYQNCDNRQSGGNNPSEPLSELSELQKIKDFLLSMDKDVSGVEAQNGGNYDSPIMSPQSDNNNKLTLFDVLKQISMKGGADDSDEESESLSFNEGDSSQEDKKDDENESEDDEDNDEDGISSTSDKSINEHGKFSETSYSSTKQNDVSSDLNVLPFYSSSEAPWQEQLNHPYVKNRFN